MWVPLCSLTAQTTSDMFAMAEPQIVSHELAMQPALGQGVHATVLCGAEAQPGTGGACCCLLYHQGKLPMHGRQTTGSQLQDGQDRSVDSSTFGDVNAV